jgi:hypothetical protein
MASASFNDVGQIKEYQTYKHDNGEDHNSEKQKARHALISVGIGRVLTPPLLEVDALPGSELGHDAAALPGRSCIEQGVDFSGGQVLQQSPADCVVVGSHRNSTVS